MRKGEEKLIWTLISILIGLLILLILIPKTQLLTKSVTNSATKKIRYMDNTVSINSNGESFYDSITPTDDASSFGNADNMAKWLNTYAPDKSREREENCGCTYINCCLDHISELLNDKESEE